MPAGRTPSGDRRGRHADPSPAAAGRRRAQPTTTVELFFDLVYVFAVTQLSHQILDDLTVAGVARAAFLLLVVWWAWIYTTWMANWFDPGLLGGPRGAHRGDARQPAHGRRAAGGVRRAGRCCSRRATSPCRSAATAAALLLKRSYRLRDVFERLVVWSAASGALWLAGATLDGDQRLCCGYRRSRSSSPRPRRATGCRVVAARPRPTTTSRAATSPSAASCSSSSRSASRSW